MEAPPLNSVIIVAVFRVRGEGTDGTALRILNPLQFQTASAKQGATTAAAAAVAAIVVAELPLEADIAATAILAAGPTSVTTDSIIPILHFGDIIRTMWFVRAAPMVSMEKLAPYQEAFNSFPKFCDVTNRYCVSDVMDDLLRYRFRTFATLGR